MQEAQANAQQQVEAIALAVGAVLGGSKSSASTNERKPETAGELTQGLQAFMSAAQNG